jgi:acid phosphatase
MISSNGISENLLPNTFGCGRLRDLDREFSKFAAEIHNPRLASLDTLLSPQLEGALPRVDGHPRLNGILDTVRAAKAHGLTIPSIFEDERVMGKVEEAVVDEWFIGYRASNPDLRHQYRRLAMGRFLDDLSKRLNEKASKPSTPLKLAIYSAHDTSLAGLLGTLDVFDNHWPAFTASFGLELFRKQPSQSILSRLGLGKDDHYVRMRYGDKTLRLPACSKSGDHLEGQPEFCTLQAFTRAVEDLRHPKGKSWEQECDEERPARSSK